MEEEEKEEEEAGDGQPQPWPQKSPDEMVVHSAQDAARSVSQGPWLGQLSLSVIEGAAGVF